MNTYNIYQVQGQIADTVRLAARLRAELESGRLNLFGRSSRRVRLWWLTVCVDALTLRLRGRF